ncbi:MAG: C4-dicarboxylate ABC transporter permease [Desulfuromonas sp.]|nr:MAG: C4-dicarboxylate ABC transporter permease [Desulfuromonas sp.]
MLDRIERSIDRFSDVLGWIAGFLMFVMLANVFYDAIMRYFFRTGSIAMQEMEWHIFSVVFLLGIAYALKDDGHVRVDILYDRFSPKWKAIVNIAGTFIFLIPLAVLIANGSTWFVHEAYTQGEISGDPGGLTHRYLIKSVIPVAFVFLIVAAAGFVIRNVRVFRGEKTLQERKLEDEVL